MLSLSVLAAFAARSEAAKREPDHVTLSGYYTFLSPIHQRDPDVQWPGKKADVELAVRVYSILSLVGSLSNSIEPDGNDLGASPFRYRTAGGGIKIDLPGPFFYDVTKKDFKSWTKTAPVNVFALAQILEMEMRNINSGAVVISSAQQFGLGADIFPGTTLSHFTLRALMFNYMNSNYLETAVGGGITF